MAPVLPVLAVAGALTSAVGTIEGGIAQGNAASYQAQVAKNNQIIANQNAAYASAAGEAQASATSMRNAAAIGKIKTAQAASGVDVNSGSASDVQESARETGQLNAETVLNNAELTSYGYRSQATSFVAQAGLDEEEARQAPIGAGLGAAGNLLSSASSIGGKWGAPGATQSGPDLQGGIWPA